jgi:hypothetical protein
MTNWSYIMLSKCLHDRRRELVIRKYGLASKDKNICLKNTEKGLMNTVKYNEMKLGLFMRLYIYIYIYLSSEYALAIAAKVYKK